jgi:SAM-dependent methyltransferase
MNNLWRVSAQSYRGMPIRCAPGVHAASLEALRSHAPSRPRLLDLASGSGAFLARLKDAGFNNLLGVEREMSSYLLKDVPCLSVDLDRPFADQIDGTFDVITAIEIIEHLSSPIAFLQEARKLLNPGGLLLVSTPNVEEWQSRIKFLLRGQLRYFDARQYRFQRHISPIFPALVPFMLEEAGLRAVSISTVGSFDGPIRRHTIGAASTVLAKLAGARHAVGECLLVTASHADSQLSKAG